MQAWLAGGEPPGTCLDRALHQWQVVLAAYDSSLIHRPIDLNG